jgi:apolipoprotein N-acyltransferase
MSEPVPARPHPAALQAPLPLWAAVLLAGAAGPFLDAAFPDRGWWPFAFLAIGMVLVAAEGRTFAAGLLIGLVFGATFYFPHIEWASLYLGPIPWSALSTLMALWCALGTALIAVATRWVPRVLPGVLARLLFVPLVIAGVWIAREAAASVWPYGGFAWGRVSESQSESPIAPLFAWIGISGVGFLMVFLVAVALGALRESRVRVDARALLVTALATLLVVFPAWPTLTEGTLRVGAVQGNARAGYFDERPFGENLLDQYLATEPIYDENVDVVLWPEGASDIDPLRDEAAAAVWDSVSERAGAPLVAGTVTTRDGYYFNTSILWHAGVGMVDFYDKRHPIPFGEYVPDRAFWRQFAPELIDLIQRGYEPGTTDMVMDVGSDGRSVLAGIAICFDIVDDQVMNEAVRDGAQVIFAQTNNADFGYTDESVQQLAFARIRAIELGRSVVNISTVGTSAVILPDGSIMKQLPTHEPGTMVEDVPLSDVLTPASVIGRHVEVLVSAAGLLALAVSGILLLSARRREEIR